MGETEVATELKLAFDLYTKVSILILYTSEPNNCKGYNFLGSPKQLKSWWFGSQNEMKWNESKQITRWIMLNAGKSKWLNNLILIGKVKSKWITVLIFVG